MSRTRKRAIKSLQDDLSYIEGHSQILREMIKEDNEVLNEYVGTLAFSLQALVNHHRNVKDIIRDLETAESL